MALASLLHRQTGLETVDRHLATNLATAILNRDLIMTGTRSEDGNDDGNNKHCCWRLYRQDRSLQTTA